jgi:Mrp family chromosome partitioning ATPase
MSGYRGLAVVSIDTLEVSVLIVAEAARALAAEGKRVIVVDLSPGGLLGRVLRVRRPGARQASLAGTEFTVMVVPADDDATPAKLAFPLLDPTGAWPPNQVLLGLAELDPAVGARYLADWVAEAVVVATTGRSSAGKVRANAEMLAVAGVTLASAMLVGTDRNDESVGESSNQLEERYPPTDRELGLLGVTGAP